MKRKVFIANPNPEYIRMFRDMNWTVLRDTMYDADLIQFTGGEDVSPTLYGETAHPRVTQINPMRDERERILFHAALAIGIPMAGICRGGQFLNVMCGGRLWQHCTKHGLAGTHQAWDTRTGETFQVTSTHHQIMIPGPKAELILLARERGEKERVRSNGQVLTLQAGNNVDVEAVHYPEQRVFCFQPHPEYGDYPELAALYFEYLHDLILNQKIKQPEGTSCAV